MSPSKPINRGPRFGAVPTTNNEPMRSVEFAAFTGDYSRTVARPYWFENGEAELVFDPWSSHDEAFVDHWTLHTLWAENIHQNVLAGNLKKPANFKWEKVFIVGRGESLERYPEVLEYRDCPAIFLNHAYTMAHSRPGDFVMSMDTRILNTEWKHGIEDLSLIALPGHSPEFITAGWKDVFGYTFFQHAPLNDWMRREYPEFPALADCISVAVSALQLAAMNGAKEIVLFGQDFCSYTKRPMMGQLLDWRKQDVWTTPPLAKMAMAVTQMANFVVEHCDCEIINASGGGLLGRNLLKIDEFEVFPWIKQEARNDD